MSDLKLIGAFLPLEMREALNQSKVFARNITISDTLREIIQTYLEKAEGVEFSENVKVTLGPKKKKKF